MRNKNLRVHRCDAVERKPCACMLVMKEKCPTTDLVDWLKGSSILVEIDMGWVE